MCRYRSKPKCRYGLKEVVVSAQVLDCVTGSYTLPGTNKELHTNGLECIPNVCAGYTPTPTPTPTSAPTPTYYYVPCLYIPRGSACFIPDSNGGSYYYGNICCETPGECCFVEYVTNDPSYYYYLCDFTLC